MIFKDRRENGADFGKCIKRIGKIPLNDVVSDVIWSHVAISSPRSLIPVRYEHSVQGLGRLQLDICTGYCSPGLRDLTPRRI